MVTSSAQLPQEIKEKIIRFQQTELTEFYVYNKLAGIIADDKNRTILQRIASEEKTHHDIWKRHTGVDVSPRRFKINFYVICARIFGLTFAVRLMEKGEEKAQHGYEAVLSFFPETKGIFDQEQQHELALIEIIHEDKLEHMGSIVLGLNDALVELTGALAGLSFALRDGKLVALAGLVTGIAASMSMAASEYLSKKAEDDPKPAKSSLYTGIAYVVTVLLLVLPYLLTSDYRIALAFTLGIAVLIIAFFTFYSSVVKGLSFKKKFFEMFIISMGVAAISFGVGVVLRTAFGIDA